MHTYYYKWRNTESLNWKKTSMRYSTFSGIVLWRKIGNRQEYTTTFKVISATEFKRKSKRRILMSNLSLWWYWSAQQITRDDKLWFLSRQELGSHCPKRRPKRHAMLPKTTIYRSRHNKVFFLETGAEVIPRLQSVGQLRYAGLLFLQTEPSAKASFYSR